MDNSNNDKGINKDLDTDIVLSDSNVSKLRSNLEELQKINSENKKEWWESVSNGEVSTIEEAFYNYKAIVSNNKEDIEFIFNMVSFLSNLSGKEKMEIKKIINGKGVIESINILSNDPKYKNILFSNKGNKTILTELIHKSKESEVKVTEFTQEVVEIGNSVEKLHKFKSKFEKGLDDSVRMLIF